jgi:hydroxymethylpyrimidine pyrophosphatase-like HAD family hydrolase
MPGLSLSTQQIEHVFHRGWGGGGTLQAPRHNAGIRMIAIDMDGTLLGEDGRVSPRNLAALLAAEAAGIEIVVATGRRHSYAMRVLRPLGLHHASALVSSNGTVTRTLGSSSLATEDVASELIARTYLPHATALWLCAHIEEFRNALVLTFDRVGPDGDDIRGALVVEHLDELHSSIGRWMAANEPYIAHVNPIENALAYTESDASGENLNAPIQAMLCGSIDRMARAEARLLEHPGVTASGRPSGRSGATMFRSPVGASSKSPGAKSPGAPSMSASSSWVEANTSTDQPEPEPLLTLHRTEYPDRDLSILDILPAGCSKGAALLSLAAIRGIDQSQILAIGDNWNDVSMLEVAGAAVLMANGPGDLKELARERGWQIGASNRNDGVADAIETALSVSATC